MKTIYGTHSVHLTSGNVEYEYKCTAGYNFNRHAWILNVKSNYRRNKKRRKRSGHV